MDTSLLRLDWCSHEAAKFACVTWHYAKAIPRTRLVKIGVWEEEEYKGCVIFNRGANNNMGRPYGLTQFQCAELVRIALRQHTTPVTRIVALSIRLLKKQSPGMRLLISYADPGHGHHGGIYQGGNWVYTGMTTPAVEHIVKGRQMHGRAVRATYGTSKGFPQVMGTAKHRYLMPLDDEMREKIKPLAKPYPKRERSAVSGTPGHQPGGGGANPTRSLNIHGC